MFKSLHIKLMLIMLMLITSLMATVGAFLTTNVSSFYIDGFFEQMNDMFGSTREVDSLAAANNPSFMADLLAAAGAPEGAAQMQKILEANAGSLGIDYRSRNYYILDGASGAVLAESDEGGALLSSTPNLLKALNGEVGDRSDLTADFMDVAIPISGEESGYIIYILDNRDTVSKLNGQLFAIIMQALVIGLLISVLFSYLLSKTLVGPIEKVTEGAERLAGGDFGNKLPVESPDEIGILTGTFNHMADVLQDSLNAVENERNKLDTLFLHMTDGVAAFDHDGRLIHCNPAATALLQRSVPKDAVYGELFGSVYPLERILALQRPNYADAEMMVGEKTLEAYFAPFSDQVSGGVLVVLHDETEHHRSEERRKEFVANVSHELRTPLTNVRSYAETLRSGGEDIPRATADGFLDIIVNETDRMTHIVQDLLTLSRLDAGNTEMSCARFDFGDSIASVVRANALEARHRGHELKLEPAQMLPVIEGDRQRLEQVMMNILGNAIKYTPDGGHILVTAGATAEHVWMEVSDDGIGIPEKDREHVFERFYRVDKARSRESGGTGLGLSIAKEIVERHRGTIRLVRHEGPGTTVRLTLPLRQKEREI